MSALDVVAGVLVTFGALLLVVAALGLLVLPDALARQHAATKAVTLALGFVLAGTMLAMRDPAWTWRLGTILAFFVVTMPVASHMLARAAAREAGVWDDTPADEPPTS